MNSFAEYCLLKESPNIEAGTPTADMRMGRPSNYNSEHQFWLIQQLQNPANKKGIAKVLEEHPELVQTLTHMIKQATHNTVDVYGHGEAGTEMLDKLGNQRVSNIMGSLGR